MREPKWKSRIMDTLTSSKLEGVDTTEARRLAENYFNDRTETKAAWHLSQPVWMLFVVAEWQHRQRRTENSKP